MEASSRVGIIRSTSPLALIDLVMLSQINNGWVYDQRLCLYESELV